MGSLSQMDLNFNYCKENFHPILSKAFRWLEVSELNRTRREQKEKARGD